MIPDYKHTAGDAWNDEKEIRQEFWNPKKGHIVVDVGARFGLYTLPALALGALVYAFEPNPIYFNALKENVQANPSFVKKAKLFQLGLSNRTIYANLKEELLKANTPKNSCYLYDNVVKFETLDNFKFTKLDYVKIDVEGMEKEVLQGARQTLLRLSPMMIVENHYQFGLASEKLENLLYELGYTFISPDKKMHLICSKGDKKSS